MKDHAQFAEDLALYAMGALDDQACPELQAHLATCPECRHELEALRADMALLALSAAGPQPPQRSRQRLTEAIAAEPQETQPQTGLIVGRLRPRWLSLMPVAVALVLAITSLGLLLEIQRLKDANAKLAQALKLAQADRDHAVEILAMLKDPEAQQMILVPTKTPPQPQVKTFYVRDKGHVLLMASNLAEPPANKAYQLWLLPKDEKGKPMPCGTFKTDWRGHTMKLYYMETAGVDAKGFAVTVEPESGSEIPTSPIVLEPGN
jgi:anti-sigma-K factor RskA